VTESARRRSRPQDEPKRSGRRLTIRLPHARLGVEGTGSADAIGAGVEGIAIDASVIITAVPDMDVNGTYADYTLVPAERLVPRPAGLDAAHAAALWVAYSTAYGAMVEKAGVRPADHVLITAASSGVGLAAIQIANQIGAIPIAVTRHAAKRDALLLAGTAAVIATDEDDLLAAVQRHTGGRGVDIILDSVMGPGLADLAKAARSGGTLVSVGWLDPRPVPHQPTAYDPPLHELRTHARPGRRAPDRSVPGGRSALRRDRTDDRQGVRPRRDRGRSPLPRTERSCRQAGGNGLRGCFAKTVCPDAVADIALDRRPGGHPLTSMTGRSTGKMLSCRFARGSLC
jgi:NADPH:quinone reductase-like Zn-dependent oxidoreductase